MAEWTNRVSRIGSKLDDKFDALKFRLRQRAGSFKRLQVLPYQGFGNSSEIYIKGRVLSKRESPKLEADAELDSTANGGARNQREHTPRRR